MTQQYNDPADQMGRRTIIAAYCQQRWQEEGHEECVFLCLRRGRTYHARDMPVKPNDPALGLDRLRKEYGRWWKRYALYSVVAVREIDMRLMKVNQPANGFPEIRVSVLNTDYADQISSLERAIDLETHDIEPFECGIDINGKTRDCLYCPNSAYNELNGLYCKAEEARRLQQQQSNYRWLPSMLKYYWQNGVDEDGLAFLRRVGFIHSYKDLQYDTFGDAVAPYGKTIPAFLLIEGWRVRYLLILIGVSLLGTVCIIAMAAAFTHSIEIALTAGSYACGVAGALIAVFTFLSAVL